MIKSGCKWAVGSVVGRWWYQVDWALEDGEALKDPEDRCRALVETLKTWENFSQSSDQVSRPKLSIKKWKDFLTRKCELESRSEQEVLLECYTNRRRRRKSDYIAKLSMESRKLSKMGTQVERSLRCQTQLKGPLCFQLCNKSLNSSMLTAYRKHAVSMVLPRDNPLLKDATSS